MGMQWTTDETALDFFARRATRGLLTGLRFLDAPVSSTSIHGSRTSESDGYQPRHVVEVSGDDATPLSLVLLHVIAAFLTRSTPDRTVEEKVYVFDHECELAAPLLLRLVRDKLQVDDPIERTALARRLLERVVVFHCRDSFQWLATLNKLHFDLLEAPPGLCLIVIHSVGSFLPIDKMIVKTAGPAFALTDQVFGILKQFIRHHSPIVFASKQTLGNVRSARDSPEYMPSSWSSQVSKRLQLRAGSGDGKHSSPDDKCFEARSFTHGKSRTLSFRVEGIALIEDKSHDELIDQEESSVTDRAVEATPLMTIAEADTNAAQLWKY